MIKIRLGNDIPSVWKFYTKDGDTRTPYIIEGKDVQIIMTDAFGAKTKVRPTITGNSASWTFYGKDQKKLGAYTFTFFENFGAVGMKALDKIQPFHLVAEQEVIESGTVGGCCSSFDVQPLVLESELPGDVAAERERAEAAEQALSDRITVIEGKEDGWDAKQEAIEDLDSIREGASKGMTALQSVPSTYRTAASQDAIDNGMKQRLSDIEGKEARWDAKADLSDIPEVVDGVTSTSTTKALSANQGKALNDRINNLLARGRFLSFWDATTGMPLTNPSGYPYEYHTGDYFIVNKVGETNYIPNGATYTGQPSTTIYTGDLKPNDSIYYDGTSWAVFDTPAGSGDIQDVYVNGSSVVVDGIAYVVTPTELKDLTGDATHRVVTDVQIAAWNAKQEVISDLQEIRSGAALGATALQSVPSTYRTASAQDTIDNGIKDRVTAIENKESGWDAKQNAISDLQEIREGAAKGTTSVQGAEVDGVSIVDENGGSEDTCG